MAKNPQFCNQAGGQHWIQAHLDSVEKCRLLFGIKKSALWNPWEKERSSQHPLEVMTCRELIREAHESGKNSLAKINDIY